MSKKPGMVDANVNLKQIQIDVDAGDIAPESNPGSNKATPQKPQTIPQQIPQSRPNTATVTIPKRNETTIWVGEEAGKPDLQKLKKYLDETHSMKNGKPYGCWDTCTATTGWHCCCGTTEKSEFDRYGVGVALYFRFVKYLIGFFFLFCILSIPSLFFSIQASINYADGYEDYKTYLYFTTVGSIGRGSTPCATDVDGGKVILSCSKGVLGELDALTYGVVTEPRDLSCNVYTFFSWTTTCNREDTSAIEYAYQGCVGLQTCELDVSQDYFDFSRDGCTTEEQDNQAFYFSASCQKIDLKLPNGDYVDRITVSYILGGCDAAISFFFAVLIISLKFSQKDTLKKIYGSIEAIEEYTIQVRNLPKLPREKLKDMLLQHFSNLLKGKKSVGNTKIVDIQFAEPHTLIDNRIELGNLKKKRIIEVRKFWDKWSDDKTGNIEVDDNKLISLADKKGKKAKKGYKKIENIKKKIEKTKEKIAKSANAKSSIVSAFITFESTRDRDKVLDAYSHNPCAPCCFSTCCSCCFSGDIHILEKKYLRVSEAPAPNNINWNNLDATKKARILRRLISWAITICLWAITIAFITWIKNRQAILAQSVQPDKDCSGLTVTREDAEADKALGDLAEGLTECYCRADAARQFKEQICIDWAFNRYLTKALPFIIVFAIIITNMIMQLVFKALASFEKHFTVTDELFSRTVKIFVAQFLNTAVIILVVNTRFTQVPIVDFLNGVYNDLIPEWYFNVGTTIIITMFINMFSLPIVNLIFAGLKGCIRCCDRRCSCDMNKTKKKTHTAYEALYTGPEFLIEIRYAQIMNLIFVCFVYGSGLPFLYVTSFFNLVIIYWLDKCYSTFLRLCKRPKGYDEKLEESLLPMMWVIVLIHIAFSVWVYGNPTIFDKNGGLDSSVELLDRVQDTRIPFVIYTIFYRAIRYQNLALSAIFVIIFVIAFLKIFFDSTVRKIFSICCKKAAMKLRSKQYEASPKYFSLIKRDDLVEEKNLVENELKNTSNSNVENFLKFRKSQIDEQLVKRQNVIGQEKDTFVGLPSYNIYHHPNYKSHMKVEGIQTKNEI